MAFTERAKLIAMAIVHIFETSQPFGEFGAYVVLDDGAGVSYGLSQFTHRSGSLRAVIEKYLALGGTVSAAKFNQVLPDLKNTATRSINKLASDVYFKKALKAAAQTSEMQQAQKEIAQSKYFGKALKACEGSNFVLPLSLAVIYDSINHGSFEKIRDRVKGNKSEKAWITEYVYNRDAWLESIPRLEKTDYRTDFFIAQIARNNWQLNLPMNVHGYQLTEKQFNSISTETSDVATSKEAASFLPQSSVDNPPTANAADSISGDATNEKSAHSETDKSVVVGSPDSNATEQTVSAEKETPAGTVTAETKKLNEQDVSDTAKVPSPDSYNGIGFWATIKRDLFGVFGANATIQTVSEGAQQIQTTVPASLLTKLAYLIAAASVIYLLFRIVHYLVDRWQQHQRAKTKAMIDSDINRKNMEWI